MSVYTPRFECGGRTWYEGQRVLWSYWGGLTGVVDGPSDDWGNVLLIALDPDPRLAFMVGVRPGVPILALVEHVTPLVDRPFA